MNKPEANNALIRFALSKPKIVTWLMVLSTTLLVALAVLPTLWPQSFPSLHALEVDTDPENMLSEDEPARIFHNQMKKEFSQSDVVVIGVVNEQHPDGVFNPQTLAHIYELSHFARGLQWPNTDEDGADNHDQIRGVVAIDLLAPSMIDGIEQQGLGSVSFDWLMQEVPETREAALSVRDRALKIPLLKDTLVSRDGKAISLYLPITDKALSYRIREALLEKVAIWEGSGDQFHITGLPVAEDTFGVEMFVQMAVSAPAAMLVIFILMWIFFRNLRLIASPMIVAMACSLTVMGLLIVTGNTVHIMSSMIPIFIMPIAVLDAVHILSEFFDRYQKTRDRKATIIAVMNELYKPMLFTSLTTTVGFASLALTPIPPVQVFGIFVAIGVFLAWFWTIMFVPAFILFIPEQKLQGFGLAGDHGGEANDPMGRFLRGLGRFSHNRPRLVIIATFIVIMASGFGISKIVINDNPIKWFAEDHAIRVADRVLNDHFGGTYMTNLALLPGDETETLDDYKQGFFKRLKSDLEIASVSTDVLAIAKGLSSSTKAEFLTELAGQVLDRLDASSDEMYDVWDAAALFVDAERQRDQLFKQPEVLRYMEGLQVAMSKIDIIGKSNSLADVIKTVHRELLLGNPKEFRIPDSSNAVAQTLLAFQNNHRPHDLWHFVTPDYRKATMWVQLTSGDNKDMSRVVEELDAYIADNPLPMGLRHQWYGLTYINVVWQEKMVTGMMEAFLSSFVIVLLMMIFLFRSVLWGLMSMAPLTLSVGMIYGMVGLLGKDYDMPVAVLSSLSLGLAIDYSIHFLARARAAVETHGSWSAGIDEVFGEPARAISRNAIVLGVGFLPLLLSPLGPYQTVGFLIAAILITSGLATLIILPMLITVLQRWLFKKSDKKETSHVA